MNNYLGDLQEQIVQLQRKVAQLESTTNLGTLSYGQSRSGSMVMHKKANETRTSTTLSNDADFFFSVGAYEYWLVEAYLDTTDSRTTDGVKVNLSLPSALFSKVTGIFTGLITVTAPIAIAKPAGASIGATAVGADSVESVHILACFQVGATGGVVYLQTAQNAAGGGTITIYQDSWMRRELISSVRV